MLELIDALINIDTTVLYRRQNSANIYSEDLKKKADKIAKAEIAIEMEKDPYRKRIMQRRLSFGITDFSDI